MRSGSAECLPLESRISKSGQISIPTVWVQLPSRSNQRCQYVLVKRLTLQTSHSKPGLCAHLHGQRLQEQGRAAATGRRLRLPPVTLPSHEHCSGTYTCLVMLLYTSAIWACEECICELQCLITHLEPLRKCSGWI